MNRYRIMYLVKSFFNFTWHYRRVKWYFHRAKHGWAPYDTWGFDMYLARVIAEGVAHLKDNALGYPACMVDGDPIVDSRVVACTDNTTEEFDIAVARWEAILGQIEKGFRVYVEADDCEKCGYGFAWKRELYDKDEPNPCEEHKVEDYDLAWDLFRKYFMGLWD